MTREVQIRLAVFSWLQEQSVLYDDVLPWAVLQNNFTFEGQKIALVGQQGIWKPKAFKSIPCPLGRHQRGTTTMD